MIHVVAGLGFVTALLFALLGLAVFLWGLNIPCILRNMLWALVVAPFAMLVCFITFVVAYPMGA